MPSKPTKRRSADNLNNGERFKRLKINTRGGILFDAIGMRSDGLGLPVSQLLMLVLGYLASWNWRQQSVLLHPKPSEFEIPPPCELAPNPDDDEESIVFISGNRLMTVSLDSGAVKPISHQPPLISNWISGLQIDPFRRHAFYLGLRPASMNDLSECSRLARQLRCQF